MVASTAQIDRARYLLGMHQHVGQQFIDGYLQRAQCGFGHARQQGLFHALVEAPDRGAIAFDAQFPDHAGRDRCRGLRPAPPTSPTLAPSTHAPMLTKSARLGNVRIFSAAARGFPAAAV
jgi:hypothetical protein